MAKKYGIVPSEMIANVIEAAAFHEGTRPTTWAGFILETAIKEKLQSGEIPQEWTQGPPKEEATPDRTIEQHWETITRKKLKGEALTPMERTFLSRQGFTPEEINTFDGKHNGDANHVQAR